MDSAGGHHVEMSHHPGGMVLQDVAVIHPLPGAIVGNPCNAYPPPRGHVYRILPGEERRRAPVHVDDLEEEAVEVKGMIHRGPVDQVPYLQLPDRARLSPVMDFPVDRELDAMRLAEFPAEVNLAGRHRISLHQRLNGAQAFGKLRTRHPGSPDAERCEALALRNPECATVIPT
jgi:hypothetical protein